MRFLTAIIMFALIAGACGGGGEADTFSSDAFAVAANRDIGVGRERLLVGVSLADGARLGSPQAAVTLEVAPLDGGTVQREPATFIWMVPEAVGLYKAEFDFDTPGVWQVTVVPEAGDPLDTVLFSVLEETQAPAVGDQAPLPRTPTTADLALEELTSDRDPDPRFYEISLPDAVASGKPTVLVFSTPAYCQTAACGPLLENVKSIIPSHADVNFIHVEVYTGLQDADFAPDSAHLAPSVLEWKLPSEPWVFVLDSQGIVRGRFEGVIDAAELEPLLP